MGGATSGAGSRCIGSWRCDNCLFWHRVAAALIAAVADRVHADVPESAIRQLAENEYQAHLHKIQLKAWHAAAAAAPAAGRPVCICPHGSWVMHVEGME